MFCPANNIIRLSKIIFFLLNPCNKTNEFSLCTHFHICDVILTSQTGKPPPPSLPARVAHTIKGADSPEPPPPPPPPPGPLLNPTAKANTHTYSYILRFHYEFRDSLNMYVYCYFFFDPIFFLLKKSIGGFYSNIITIHMNNFS